MKRCTAKAISSDPYLRLFGRRDFGPGGDLAGGAIDPGGHYGGVENWPQRRRSDLSAEPL